jgi:hypothetical protein
MFYYIEVHLLDHYTQGSSEFPETSPYDNAEIQQKTIK